MKSSKATVTVNVIIGKILSIIGYSFGIFGLIGIAVETTRSGDAFGIILALIFIAIGILLVLKGLKIKRRVKRFRRYVSLISIQNMVSLDSIADYTTKSVDFVRKDLQNMIDKKFFTNAIINEESNEIVIARVSPPTPISPVSPIYTHQTQIIIQSAPSSPPIAPVEERISICNGCGASNKIVEKIGVCDYCGSYIQ